MKIAQDGNGSPQYAHWFAKVAHSCQDYFRIQNMKVFSRALNIQNPKPKSDPGSLTKSYHFSRVLLEFFLNIAF